MSRLRIVSRRRSTINHQDRTVPYIRLSGKRLAQLGFPVGGQFRVEYANGRVTLCAVANVVTMPAAARTEFERVRDNLDRVLQPTP